MLALARSIARAVWAVLGLYMWIPWLSVAFAGQVGALIMLVWDRDQGRVRRTAAWLQEASNFYRRGFEVISERIQLDDQAIDPPPATDLDRQRADRKALEAFLITLFLATAFWVGLWTLGYVLLTAVGVL